MNEETIYDDGNEDIAEKLSLIYQRDSRRMSKYIDAETEVLT